MGLLAMVAGKVRVNCASSRRWVAAAKFWIGSEVRRSRVAPAMPFGGAWAGGYPRPNTRALRDDANSSARSCWSTPWAAHIVDRGYICLGLCNADSCLLTLTFWLLGIAACTHLGNLTKRLTLTLHSHNASTAGRSVATDTVRLVLQKSMHPD